ncbi:MAG: hypothetical protein RR446_12155 [Lachnospiraceae bacterium]
MNVQTNVYSNYDLQPYTEINGYEDQAFDGYDQIVEELLKSINGKKRILVCDCYPGVDKEEVLEHFKNLNPVLIIDTDDCAYEEAKLTEMFADYLTEDRVFGVMCHKSLEDCFCSERLQAAKNQLEQNKNGIVLVIGTGASFITFGDIYVYFDMARWELQLRYRNA